METICGIEEIGARERKNDFYKIETLDDLCKAIGNVFESDTVNVETIHKLMAAYKSNPLEWRKYAKFDKHKYTRNLIDEGNGKYNLILLCWGGGHGSAIHDHADAHCFMKILNGSLSEIRFSWPSDSGPMVEISRNTLETNSVCYINDTMGLHRVENISYSEPACSLHLYCPPFNQCSVFNQQTGTSNKSNVTFWSKFGNKPEGKKQHNGPPEDN